MIKVLHSADWHIGKRYNNTDFLPDFKYFAEQLCEIIREQDVDVLLVSGDVFDVYAPSNEAQEAYFSILKQLSEITSLKKIIITGGNHDSPSFLSAPAQILSHLNIEIFSQAGAPEDAWISIPADDKPLNIACIPFLRHQDFTELDANATYQDRKKRNAQGLMDYYEKAFAARPKNGGWYVGMGHFTCINQYAIDSEREISIGTIDATDKKHLPDFDYLAMGHIHKPLTASKSRNIYYSGSPYPMSFSEKNDEKRLMLLTFGNSIEVKSIPLNSLRQFVSVSGKSIQEIHNHLESFRPNHNLTQMELVLHVEKSTISAYKALQSLSLRYNEAWQNAHVFIEKVRIANILNDNNLKQRPGVDYQFKSPSELLEKIIEHRQNQYEEDAPNLKQAFDSILSKLNL